MSSRLEEESGRQGNNTTGKGRIKQVYLASADILCKPNSILSCRVVKNLTENGIEMVDSPAKADMIVINTCGFDKEHEQISTDLYRSALAERKAGAPVVSIGCLNKINRGLIEKKFPGVTIADDLGSLFESIGPAGNYDDAGSRYMDRDLLDKVAGDPGSFPLRGRLTIRFGELVYKALGKIHGRALDSIHLGQVLDEVNHANKFYVEIGSGCVGRCSYCIIKKAKGDPSSRRIQDIIADIEQGWKPGQAVNLVADDCASYGVDTGTDIFKLVDAIDERFPGIPLELCYVNPYWMDRYPDRFLDMFTRHNINSVNISMQTGSQRLIRLMNRNYNVEKVLDLIKRIRQASPGTMIWTHFLLGFPTESWSDYYKTIRASFGFDFYYGFVYSPREGTRSAQMENTNPYIVRRVRKTLLFVILGGRILKGLVFGRKIGDSDPGSPDRSIME